MRIARLLLCLSLLSVAGWGVASDPATPAPRELVFLNWNEYVDPGVIADFEKKFNVRVKEVYFGSEDETVELMIATGGKGYDVILVPGSMIASYVRRNWLAPLDKSKIPNLHLVQQRWINGFEQSETYGVPYLWGTMGLVYRKDLLTKPPTSWMDVYRPEPGLKGKILMPEDTQELVGLAFKALGYSLNEEDPKAFEEVEGLLDAQKSFVHAYAYPDLSAESNLSTGEIALSLTYNGDALLLMENTANENIAFSIPEEGTLLWGDYLVISAQTQHPDLAHAFVNFIHEPENARRTAETLYYATTNDAAEKLLPQAHLEDPVIHPPQPIIARSEFLRQKSPRTMKRWNALFARLAE